MKPAAIVFDLFGTLLNIDSLQTAAAQYCADPAAFVTTWRDKQLAYAFAATILDRYEDFDSLTTRALAFAAAKHGLPAHDRGWESLDGAWRTMAPHPDARAAIDALRGAGFRCLVLTNATAVTAQAAIAAAGLGDAIEKTLSVDAAGAYKPDARVYALATAYVTVPAERLLFVTANGWDASGAGTFGLPVAWCNRSGAPAETFGPEPQRTIADLRELASVVAAM